MDLFFDAPDWQKSDDYSAVSDFDRAGLAWEFVRRDPQYRDIIMADRTIIDTVAGGVTIVPDEPPPLPSWGLSFR